MSGWFSSEPSHKQQNKPQARDINANTGAAPTSLTDAKIHSERSFRLDLCKKRNPVLVSSLHTRAGTNSYRVSHKGSGESPPNPNRSTQRLDTVVSGLTEPGGCFSHSNNFAYLVHSDASKLSKTLRLADERSLRGAQQSSATGATSSRRHVRLIAINPVCIQFDSRVGRQGVNLSEDKRVKEAESKKRIELRRQYLRGVARWEQQEKQKKRIYPRKDPPSTQPRDVFAKERNTGSLENNKVSASLSVSFHKRQQIFSPITNFF